MCRTLIIFTFILSLTSISFSSETDYFMMLKYSKVNVRFGPSRDHPIKFIYEKLYLPVKVIDKKDNFRKIIDNKKNSGWIHSSQLKKNSSVILKDTKILFNKPSKYSKPLAKIKTGRLLILKKCENEWCKVETDNFKGGITVVNLWGYENKN